MLGIQGSLLNIIISFYILKFYNIVNNIKMKKHIIYIVSLIYPFYRILTSSITNEPLRLFLSLLFFIVTVIFLSKNISIAIIGVSFLIIHLLSLIAILLAVITVFLFDIQNELLIVVIGLACPLALYQTFDVLDKKNKINIASFGRLMEKNTIKKMIGTIGVLVIILYIFVNIGASLDAVEDSAVSMLIWSLSITVALAIIFLIIFTVKHLNDEKRKQEELELENARLEQERLAMQNQLAELDAVYTTLKKDFGKVTSNYHSYKYSMPVLLNMQHKLLEEINPLSTNTTSEKLNRIQNYINQVKTLSFQINHDFIADHVKIEIASLNIPQDHLQLVSLLERLMTKAQEHEAYLSIQNNTNIWHEINGSDIVLLRLISNIVDNAIKESCKIPQAERGEIRLVLADVDGIFTFEVSDRANEFNLDILQKLGTRKNSSNGTGDGYAEVMNDLNKSQASLIIQEWQRENRFGKTISVIFDGCNMKLIDSNYRQDLLKHTLVDSELEVLDDY